MLAAGPCQVAFGKLLLADYVWAHACGPLDACLAVERKTYENLVAGSGGQEQLRHTGKLRAAGHEAAASKQQQARLRHVCLGLVWLACWVPTNFFCFLI